MMVTPKQWRLSQKYYCSCTAWRCQCHPHHLLRQVTHTHTETPYRTNVNSHFSYLWISTCLWLNQQTFHCGTTLTLQFTLTFDPSACQWVLKVWQVKSPCTILRGNCSRMLKLLNRHTKIMMILCCFVVSVIRKTCYVCLKKVKRPWFYVSALKLHAKWCMVKWQYADV